jgi:chemotaxis protein CheZ
MSLNNNDSIKSRYGARVEALNAAMAKGDEQAFGTVLDDLLHSRKPEVFNDLRDLTANLKVALDRFRLDARLADFAEKEMPDARQRLTHVLDLTNQAAHRTLDLVEQSGPPAERTAQAAKALAPAWKSFRARKIELRDYHEMLKRMDAFLPAAQADSETIRHNLSEVLLTQGYQDLTGQIIRSVIELVREIEAVLAELARLSGVDPEHAASTHGAARGHGPVVPGVTQGEVASGQQDVDALLSGLGM